MTMPVNLEHLPLPVTPPLLTLLGDECKRAGVDLTNVTTLTFHFRNPRYHPDTAGVHPVDICLVCQAGCWCFDYITDFSYQDFGPDAELGKELDFKFLNGEHRLQGWGPLPVKEAEELFTLWQHIFLAYAQQDVFTVTVSTNPREV
ncbi:hypothetical protein HNP12_003727 [Aeromonas hydrophila]|uniref:DUF2787 domain-containing protein n=1 Tax=Aeromonas hydrophila TaxID=644 RepID=UPI0021678424|nr:DUF2787 domain-containing protein [Aeromonas hydrophila]MCS3769606.1 hypothetical protein [Aeromonas hydrophila]